MPSVLTGDTQARADAIVASFVRPPECCLPDRDMPTCPERGSTLPYLLGKAMMQAFPDRPLADFRHAVGWFRESLHRVGWQKLDIQELWEEFAADWYDYVPYFPEPRRHPEPAYSPEYVQTIQQYQGEVRQAIGDVWVPMERAILMARHMGRNGPFRCSAKFAAGVIGCSQEEARKLLQQLVCSDVLMVTERGGGVSRLSTQYALVQNPAANRV